jgi:heme o synthase
MFHGSLLYLPALMAGLILHRLPNEQKEHNIHQTSEIAGVLRGAEERARQKWEDPKPSRAQSRPPVAYASVAPFPFLPVPVYVSPQAHD